MEEITIKTESNKEIWELIDKKIGFIFLHKFNPNQAISWWKTDLKLKHGEILQNITVRQMEFDLQTDLPGLKKLIDLNTQHLSVYQFEKPISDTLVLERLPENSKEQILRQNGLNHIFWIDFEFLTIRSFDKDFINSIANNPQIKKRI